MVGSVAIVTSQRRAKVSLTHVIFFVRFAANYIMRDIDLGFRIQDTILTNVMRQEIHIDHVHDGAGIMS